MILKIFSPVQKITNTKKYLTVMDTTLGSNSGLPDGLFSNQKSQFG
jgi:hypothetical protein